MVKCNFREKEILTYVDGMTHSTVVKQTENYICKIKSRFSTCDEEECILQKVLKKVK